MAWSLEIAELVDWFLIHLDDWTEPVTVGQLDAAGSEYTKGQIVAAIRHLQEMSLVYRHREEAKLVYWLPEAKRPRAPIQDLICLGSRKFYERATP